VFQAGVGADPGGQRLGRDVVGRLQRGTYVIWFGRDQDAGYIAWLRAHPDGFVVNTHLPPGPGYLILHRASCKTISRDLPGVRSWTRRYGKACASTSGELHDWAAREVGGWLHSCGLCGGDG
jgi:hypothetical protein